MPVFMRGLGKRLLIFGLLVLVLMYFVRSIAVIETDAAFDRLIMTVGLLSSLVGAVIWAGARDRHAGQSGKTSIRALTDESSWRKYLPEIDLSGQELFGKDFSNCYLRNAVLTSAKMQGANLVGAYLGRHGEFEWVEHEEEEAREVPDEDGMPTGMYTGGTSRSGVVWVPKGRTQMQNADFRDADLRRANVDGSLMNGANLSNADLRGVSFKDCDLRGTNLAGADLRGADLTRARLWKETLRGAETDGSTKLPTGF
jgi:hypothetical protein